MNIRFALLPLVPALLLLAVQPLAASAPNFAGEYADKNFLNGQGVFQMSLEQSGSTVSVWFSAAYNDGHGCGPEATTSGKATSKGTVEFTFHDSSRNVGTGTIVHAGNDIVVSIKTTRVADPRCLVFYKPNMRLQRVGRK